MQKFNDVQLYALLFFVRLFCSVYFHETMKFAGSVNHSPVIYLHRMFLHVLTFNPKCFISGFKVMLQSDGFGPEYIKLSMFKQFCSQSLHVNFHSVYLT